MKILQLTYTLSSGGGERFVVDLSNELSKHDEIVLVQIVSNENEDMAHYLGDVAKSVKYINLNCKSGLSNEVFYRVYKTIKAEKPDLVHIHCGLFAAILAVLFYKKTKYVHTLHSLAHRCLYEDSKYLKPIYRFLYKKTVKPITISNACNQSFVDLYGINTSVRINNGRSPIMTTNAKEIVKREIDSYKEHEDDKTFIHVARYHSVKNQILLFNTFERLQNEGEHVLLIVIGNGYSESPLKEYCNRKNGILLLGEKKNVGDYLAASDYFIMSSLMEGLPISLLEAMSLGVIPISTPAGGVCDVIRNGENGYISYNHEPEVFYNTVKQAIENKEEVTSAVIKEEFAQSYSMKTCAQNYYAQYKTLLAK